MVFVTDVFHTLASDGVTAVGMNWNVLDLKYDGVQNLAISEALEHQELFTACDYMGVLVLVLMFYVP